VWHAHMSVLYMCVLFVCHVSVPEIDQQKLLEHGNLIKASRWYTRLLSSTAKISSSAPLHLPLHLCVWCEIRS